MDWSPNNVFWLPPPIIELHPLNWLLVPPPIMDPVEFPFKILQTPPPIIVLSDWDWLFWPPEIRENPPVTKLHLPPTIIDESPPTVLFVPPSTVEYREPAEFKLLHLSVVVLPPIGSVIIISDIYIYFTFLFMGYMVILTC